MLLLSLALGLIGSSVNVAAAAECDDSTKAVYKVGQYPAQKAAGVLRTANAKVDKKADYYIYLQSASWCGPCQKEMPEIAAEYVKMKKSKKVELILVSWDRSSADALTFVKSNKAKFPVVMKDDKKVDKLVGFTMAQGIPSAIIVDKYGNVVKSGHGSIVKDWKSYCVEQDAE